MNAREMDRIIFVTRHYRDLQGFRTVGESLRCVVVILWFGNDFGLDAWMNTLLCALLYGATGLLIRRAEAYYSNRFGETQAKKERIFPWAPAWVLLLLAVAWIVVVSLRSRTQHDNVQALMGCGLATVFLIGLWIQRGFRLSQSYYLLIGAACLCTPFLVPPGTSRGIAILALGAAVTLAGLLDHWQLIRALHHGPELEQDALAPAEVER